MTEINWNVSVVSFLLSFEGDWSSNSAPGRDEHRTVKNKTMDNNNLGKNNEKTPHNNGQRRSSEFIIW